VTGDVVHLEPWLTREKLAEYLGCSVRSVDNLKKDGMPWHIIVGKPKFRPSEVEAWLEENGHKERVA
jgi:hypothetical protein